LSRDTDQAGFDVVQVDFALAPTMSFPDVKYDGPMGRWEPNASGRLQQAAMQLYFEQGFERTTVAEIAEQAGLTERTFFRHFADKREVLFWGARALQDSLVDSVLHAAPLTSPLVAVAQALEGVSAMFEERREGVQQRQSIIAANQELQERELIKLAVLAAAIANALRQRGVKEPTASLAAEAGIAVFRIAFESWVSQSEERSLRQVISDSFTELEHVATDR
jgi:AcrR family transcriptional regulator